MNKKSILASLLFLCIACNNKPDEQKPDGKEKKDSLTSGIKETSFFANYENKEVMEYTLTNTAGVEIGIINYGGTITRIMVPDKEAVMGDVVLGYTGMDGFLQKGNPYFNSLIGRYANRIANAKFKLDGKEYTLAANDYGNSLHGGNKGYDKVWWNIEKLPGDSSLKLTYLSKDGEEGYPGNLNIAVTYSLSRDNTLTIDYTATTDKATPVNLTSHCYFNLSAGKDSTILGHLLELNADKYTPVNGKLIPTGKIADVKGSPMDFTRAKAVGKEIESVKGGYDHNWVLNKKGSELEKIASLYDPGSGRLMEVWTTEPGLQFYSGNFLDGTLSSTKNNRYVKHAALCLEAQHFPDSPNQPGFPTTILKPGETYKQTTAYRFSIK